MSGGDRKLDAAAVWSTFDGRRGLLNPAVERLLVALAQSNRAQWDAEDRARTAPTADGVAEEKSLIDRLNAQRVRLIYELDLTFSDLIAPSPSAPPAADTPGSLCDRLSVLRLRMLQMSETEVPVSRRARVEAQANQLRWAFDVLLGDLRDGRRSFSPHEPNKLYAGNGSRSGAGQRRATDDEHPVAHRR